jgi:Fe-Mn family superoxide dismutase
MFRVILTALTLGSAAALQPMPRGLIRMSATAEPSDRRAFGKTLAAAAGAILASNPGAAVADDAYALPPLPYDYAALEPAIGAPTMKLHHDKHHQVYITNANKAVADMATKPSLLELQTKAISAGPLARNGGGGAYNHDMFWDEMTSPKNSGKPSANLAKAIDDSFGSFEEMQAKFGDAATTQFGSGWAWLCVTKDKKLAVTKTPNQDNPLMEGSAAGEVMYPILGLDVWEHAYYLDYQNRRPEYIKAFWSVINWAKVSEYYETGMKGQGVPF